MNVLITGTSKGLGGGLASYYLEKGHSVYSIGRNINKELDNYPEYHFISQDLSKFDEMEDNLPGFLKQAEEFDLVILNAGVLSEIKDLKDCGLDEILRVMDINVWSNKILIDLLFSNIKKIKQVAAISSGASVYGNRGWNGYSISKAALNMMIKLYSGEMPDTHFCSVAPGLIDSGMQEYIYSLPDDNRFPSVRKLKAARESGQMPGPDEAAAIVAGSLAKALEYESGSFLDVREIN